MSEKAASEIMENKVIPLHPRVQMSPRSAALPPSNHGRPSVFDYTDAVEFIASALKSFKTRNPGFSQRALARVLGISSPGFFNLVLNRKRPLNAALGKEVEKFFINRDILKPGEETYFQYLIKAGLAQTEEERRSLLDSLAQLKHDRERYMLSLQDLNVLHRWEALALLDAVNLKDFQYNPQYLYKLFRGTIPAHELVFMVEHLVRKGLLEHVDGKLRTPVISRTSTNETHAEQRRSLHRQFILESLKSLDNTKVDDRSNSAYTMCINKEKLPEAKALIIDFHRKLARLLDCKEGDAVYQLNTQFFPLLGGTDET
jgi:uncharacterized protein (TIGR02147 family)